MKKNQTFAAILLGVTAIGIQQLWSNTFTSMIMVIAIIAAIVLIVKDFRSE